MSPHYDITLTVNGERIDGHVEGRKSLVDFLRDDLTLTGSHIGCEHGVCGACTVRVNGEIVRGCLILAVQCDGAVVETIEGVSDTGEIADLQDAFEKRNALQCGFCTPGMLLTAQELLSQTKNGGQVPSRDDIREHISGNYCRCTGYHAIVDAVESVAAARHSASSFRGASEGREPGIHSHTQNVALDSGPGASKSAAADLDHESIRSRVNPRSARRPGMTENVT